jgi:hypothetical protein
MHWLPLDLYAVEMTLGPHFGVDEMPRCVTYARRDLRVRNNWKAEEIAAKLTETFLPLVTYAVAMLPCAQFTNKVGRLTDDLPGCRPS